MWMRRPPRDSATRYSRSTGLPSMNASLHRVAHAPPVIRSDQPQERAGGGRRLWTGPAVEPRLLGRPSQDPVLLAPFPTADARDALGVLKVLSAEFELDRERLGIRPGLYGAPVEDDEATEQQHEHERRADGRLPQRSIGARAVTGPGATERGDDGVVRAEDLIRRGPQARRIAARDDPDHRGQRRQVDPQRRLRCQERGGRRRPLQRSDARLRWSARPRPSDRGRLPRSACRPATAEVWKRHGMS